ncbi:MAG: BACON domain-containing protein [Bacteroidales bacterium]|nr:BACON domain-containing protein [Bacteroidales bacterium]
MKKIYIALMALLAVAACKEKEINLASRVIISQTEELVVEAENVPTLAVEVISDGDWVVVTPDWISASPRYGRGDGTILFNIADNYTNGEMNADRQATVSVECASGASSFLVKQAGDPMKGNVYLPVTEVRDGGVYLLVAPNKDGDLTVASPITSNYGYIQVTTEIMGDAEKIAMASADYEFTFVAVDGGWNIVQPDNRFVYQTGTYNSFNVAAEIPADAAGVWKVEFDADGYATITNVGMNKWMQYSQNYNSYGCYPSDQDSGVLPRLYEKVENQ